ncbi:hypothetical protein V8C86DRAFT_1790597, partial [Haematococcus lacustris]
LVNTRLIAASHLEDRARGLTEQHIQQICFFVPPSPSPPSPLTCRCRVAAVAITYFRKFYLRNSFGGVEHDPTLIHVGCLYLASKAEETVLNARYFATTMARKWPGYPYDTRHILDAEMIILKDLDFNLVVFNPYRPLLQLLEDSRAPPDVAQLAWGAMNDCYRCGCDATLTAPPHILALACLTCAWAVHSQATQPPHLPPTSLPTSQGPVALSGPPPPSHPPKPSAEILRAGPAGQGQGAWAAPPAMQAPFSTSLPASQPGQPALALCSASGLQGGVAGGEAGQQQGGGGGVGEVAGQVAAVGAKAWAWQEWLGGLKVEWEQVRQGGGVKKV